jgi:hypothetical protein
MIATSRLFDPSMTMRAFLKPKLLVHQLLHDRIALEVTVFTSQIPVGFLATSRANGQKARWTLQRSWMLLSAIDLFAVDCRATSVFLRVLFDIASERSFNQELEGLARQKSAKEWNWERRFASSLHSLGTLWEISWNWLLMTTNV